MFCENRNDKSRVEQSWGMRKRSKPVARSIGCGNVSEVRPGPAQQVLGL